jgi:copper chaperone
MKTYQVKIDGMTCNHCVMAVKKEFSKMPAIDYFSVEIGNAEISADETQITDEHLRKAIEEAGYSVVSIE